MECSSIIFSVHANLRMWQRRIHPDDVVQAIRHGQVLLEDPTAQPYPKRLMLGYSEMRPRHVVVAVREDDKTCIVVTIYWPDPELWEADWKTRRSK